MMRAGLTPSELYTRVDLDAQIEGSSGRELTRICFDALIGALGRAAHSTTKGDRRTAVNCLARAAAILGGLQRSVDPEAEMGDVLIEFYGSISARLRDLISLPLHSDITELRRDVAEVAAALVPQDTSNALLGTKVGAL